MEPRIRPAALADAEAMALAHVRSWRETYRGLLPPDVLDAPDAVARRVEFWAGLLAAGRPAAAAERGGEIVGVALAAPCVDGPWQVQLHILYVVAAAHGSGAGVGLLQAVVDPGASAVLWVADPNPRAQAFYRKSGFTADGATGTELGMRVIRMVRPSA